MAALEVSRSLGLMRVSRILRRVGAAVFVELDLADTVVCLWGTVCESSQLAVEPERADLGSILIAYAPGIKCLVHNGEGKFAGLVQGLPDKEPVFTHERLGLETNVLDIDVLAHESLFLLAGETV
jgi:hypothetical protein